MDDNDSNTPTTPPLRLSPQSRGSNGLTANDKIPVRKLKKNEDGVLKLLGDWFFENQIGMSCTLISVGLI
jgi:hypothetical protein